MTAPMLIAVEKMTKTASPPRFVLRRIKGPHLCRNISLQKTRADDEQKKSEEEGLVKSHGDMTGTHREGADHDGVALSDPTIGDHAAEKRCEVNETGVEPKNLRRKRLR
jgi:hypothetical protein